MSKAALALILMLAGMLVGGLAIHLNPSPSGMTDPVAIWTTYRMMSISAFVPIAYGIGHFIDSFTHVSKGRARKPSN